MLIVSFSKVTVRTNKDILIKHFDLLRAKFLLSSVVRYVYKDAHIAKCAIQLSPFFPQVAFLLLLLSAGFSAYFLSVTILNVLLALTRSTPVMPLVKQFHHHARSIAEETKVHRINNLPSQDPSTGSLALESPITFYVP